MFELILVAMFQAVMGAPAPAAVTDTPAATGDEHAGHAAPAETAPPTNGTTAAPAETPSGEPAQEADDAAAQQQQAQQESRVCREEASSGSRLRARRRC